MFIRVTFENDVMYVNVNHIQILKPHMRYTQIWLSDGDAVTVNETESQILKLIEEAREAR